MTRARSRGIRFAASLALLASLALGLLVGPAQVSAQADQDDSGVDGNSYVSPAFGYSLEWDRTWEVTAETVEVDYNMLQLGDGNSILYFEGYNFPTDPAECVETVIGTLEDDESLTDLDSTAAVATEADAAAADLTFVILDEDGEDVDYNGYVECRVINDGEVTLAISHYGVADGWDDSVEGRDEILTSFEAGSAPVPGDDESDDTDDSADTDPVDTSGTDDLLSEVQGDGDVPNNVDDVLVLFEASINDVLLYWDRQFPLISGGQEFIPPSFVPYIGTLDTACGPIESWDPDFGGTGPVQCSADATVYLDIEYTEYQYEQIGGEVPFLVTSVVAHEVGHHVQDLLGMVPCYETPCLDPNQVTGLEFEYMADCFAGAWAADAQLRGRLGMRDVDLAIVQFATTLGGGAESADWGSHGTGAERTWWFLNGYVEGAATCFEASDVTRSWLTDTTGTGGDETPEATDEPTTDETETPEETPDNGNTGGATELGDAVEITLGTLIATETRVETAIDNRDADGQFVIVFFEIELADDGPFDYSGWTVVDGDGEIYELDERATDLYLSSAYPDGMDEEFEADALFGIALVFDIPASAEGLTLVNDAEGVSIALDI